MFQLLDDCSEAGHRGLGGQGGAGVQLLQIGTRRQNILQGRLGPEHTTQKYLKTWKIIVSPGDMEAGQPRAQAGEERQQRGGPAEVTERSLQSLYPEISMYLDILISRYLDI